MATNKKLISKIVLNDIKLVYVLALVAVLWILGSITFELITSSNGTNITGQFMFYSLFAFIATLLIHELIHGLFFKIFGGKVKFGMGMMYQIMPIAYATSPGSSYTLNKMLIIALSPLILISPACIFLALSFPQVSSYMEAAFLANLVGAGGDILMSGRLLKLYKKGEGISVVDQKYGLDIYQQA